MTQKQRILARLQTGEWLSSVQAVRELYIMRLGARIWNLRHEGYDIEERRVQDKPYSEYRLIQKTPAFPSAFKPTAVAPPEINQKLFA